MNKKNSGMAIASLVLGIFSIFLFWTFIVPTLAVIFGIISLNQIKKDKNLDGKNMAIWGLVLGAIWFVLIIILVSVGIGWGIINNLDENSSNSNSVSIQNNPTSNNNFVVKNNNLEILESNLTYGQYGNLIVSGIAKNIAGKELNYAEVDVKFYDGSGAVLDTSLDNINNLGDGENWKFQVYYLGTDEYNVKNYSISIGSTW